LDYDWLADATSASRKIAQQVLANSLGIHRDTLRRNLKEHDLYNAIQFADISSDDLDTLLRFYKQRKPNSGVRYAAAFLRVFGIRVQQKRIHQSLQRIDGLGQILRNHAAIDRRTYEVPRPNHLWHIDGYHKLIRWGFVIHGGADGFCRTVSGQILLASSYLTNLI
jgi:hypothetical protein